MQELVCITRQINCLKTAQEGEVTLLQPRPYNKLMLQWEGSFNVVDVVNRIVYRAHDKFGTYHINLLKKFEDRDVAVMISGMVILEARLSSEICVVDNES